MSRNFKKGIDKYKKTVIIKLVIITNLGEGDEKLLKTARGNTKGIA